MALGWSASPSSLLVNRAGHAAFSFNKNVYVLGGTKDFTNPALYIEKASVNADGSLQPFVNIGGLPQPLLTNGVTGFGFAQRADRIYVVGGADATLAATTYANVAVGQVQPDGQGILWSAGPSLPVALANCECAIVGDWLYATGGVSSVLAPSALIAGTSGSPTLALGSISGNSGTITLASQTFSPVPTVGAIIVIPTTSALADQALTFASLVEQDITYTAVTAGAGGNSITITYVNPGTTNQGLSVGVVGNAITVNLATNSVPALTSTATQIQAAVAAYPAAAALVTGVVTGTGSTVETAAASTPLAGGFASTLGNAGVYVVAATASSTAIPVTKVRDIGATTVTAPVAQTAKSVVATNDVQLRNDVTQATQVQASRINSDGSLQPWVQAANFPGASPYFNTVGHVAQGGKKHLFIHAGQPQGVSGTQKVWRGLPDRGDGAFILWDTEPMGLASVRVFAAGFPTIVSKEVIIGGSSDGTAANVLNSSEELTMNSDGSIRGSAGESAIPVALDFGACCSVGRYIYFLGGENSSGTPVNTVYVAALQDDISF